MNTDKPKTTPPASLNPAAKRYLEMMPIFEEEKTQKISALVLTFLALSILGIFAIRPSLTTISDLKKELQDNKRIEDALQQKIVNLGSLQTQYYQIEQDIPVVLAAIPQVPLAPILMGQLHALAVASSLSVDRSQVFQVQLSKGVNQQNSAYEFTFEASGTNDNIQTFLNNLTNFDRIIVLTSVSLTTRKEETNPTVILRGRAFFKE